jgi:hypothetical protein
MIPRLLSIGLVLLTTIGTLPFELAVHRQAGQEKELVSLFNGKDLTGWDGDPSLWSVQEGVIVGKHPQDKTTNRYLCTKEKYGDFVLQVSWKLLNPKGNSGVQIRSEPLPNLLVAGYQVEIAGANCGGIFEEIGRGWLAKPDAKWKEAVKFDDWNRYVITAKGDQVTVSVNGVAITELRDQQGRKSGVIGLQHYQGEVRFKDIKIKKL